MSRTKKTQAPELRAEMARKRVPRREVAEALGISTDYVNRILNGSRKAPERREQIWEYVSKKKMRGVA